MLLRKFKYIQYIKSDLYNNYVQFYTTINFFCEIKCKKLICYMFPQKYINKNEYIKILSNKFVKKTNAYKRRFINNTYKKNKCNNEKNSIKHT